MTMQVFSRTEMTANQERYFTVVWKLPFILVDPGLDAVETGWSETLDVTEPGPDFSAVVREVKMEFPDGIFG